MDLEKRPLRLAWSPDDGIPLSTWADAACRMAVAVGATCMSVETDSEVIDVAWTLWERWDKLRAAEPETFGDFPRSSAHPRKPLRTVG